MSTAVETSTEAPTRRVKPHQLALILFTAIACFTVVSGILPQITGWENDNAVHRTVFVNIPGPLQIAFYTDHPGAARVGGDHVREPDEELGARCAGTAHDHVQERQAAPRRLPRRRVHADAVSATPAPASCTR